MYILCQTFAGGTAAEASGRGGGRGGGNGGREALQWVGPELRLEPQLWTRQNCAGLLHVLRRFFLVFLCLNRLGALANLLLLLLLLLGSRDFADRGVVGGGNQCNIGCGAGSRQFALHGRCLVTVTHYNIAVFTSRSFFRGGSACSSVIVVGFGVFFEHVQFRVSHEEVVISFGSAGLAVAGFVRGRQGEQSGTGGGQEGVRLLLSWIMTRKDRAI